MPSNPSRPLSTIHQKEIHIFQPFCVPRPCGICLWRHRQLRSYSNSRESRFLRRRIKTGESTTSWRGWRWQWYPVWWARSWLWRNIQLLIVRELTIGAKPWGSNEQWRWIWMFFFIFCCRATGGVFFSSPKVLKWSWLKLKSLRFFTWRCYFKTIFFEMRMRARVPSGIK